jgi:hypothetical protein
MSTLPVMEKDSDTLVSEMNENNGSKNKIR